MTGTIAILKKELGIYFTTVIAYLGLGAYAFLMSLLFVTSLNRFQQLTDYALTRQEPELLERLNFNDAILSPMYSTGMWMFLFFVPFLTMRLFAEERAMRTFELLLTTPVRTAGIVLGKYLAAGTCIVLMAVLPLMYPLILELYGTGSVRGPVEWAPVWSATLTIALLGLFFSAVGLLFSAISESQVVSALLTFAALLVALVLPMIAQRVDGAGRVLLEYLAPTTHVTRGIEGRIHVRDLMYFVSGIFLLLVLAHRTVESFRWR